jgi:hypothetical protein
MQHQRTAIRPAEVIRDGRQCIPAPNKDVASVRCKAVMRLNLQFQFIA